MWKKNTQKNRFFFDPGRGSFAVLCFPSGGPSVNIRKLNFPDFKNCVFFFGHLRGDAHFALCFPTKREIGEHFWLHPPLVGAVNCGKFVSFLLLGVAEEEEEED